MMEIIESLLDYKLTIQEVIDRLDDIEREELETPELLHHTLTISHSVCCQINIIQSKNIPLLENQLRESTDNALISTFENMKKLFGSISIGNWNDIAKKSSFEAGIIESSFESNVLRP